MKNRAVVALALGILLLSAAAVDAADCSTLTFLTESLPDFPVGQPVHADLQVIGGTAPYSFAVSEGTLPAGLHLTPNGQLRGVPTEVTDTTVFFTVTDANGCTLTMAYPVRVV
jgi:hypothetical protein